MTATISVCNWKEFQHYKDRDPPWIKLYRDVLSSEVWVMGTDISRLVQLAITLLAARYKNEIPYNIPLLKRVGSIDCSENAFRGAIEHLLANNFIEIKGGSTAASYPLAGCATVDEGLYSEGEQSRAEQRESRAEDLSSPKPLDDVRRVFDHWRSTWNHPQSALDTKRRVLIGKALKGYSADTLCESISGYLNSPHHCGQNDRQTVYDGLHVFLRDSDHIDAGLRFARAPPVLTSDLAQKNVAILSQWKPPEIRDAQSGHAEISVDHGIAGGGLRKTTLAAAR